MEAPQPTEGELVLASAALCQRLVNACLEADVKAVLAALDDGADPNCVVPLSKGSLLENVVPLEAAALAISKGVATPKILRKQVTRICKLIMDAGGVFLETDTERKLLVASVLFESEDLLNLLVERGANLFKFCVDLFGFAFSNRSVSMVANLVSHGMNPNAKDAFKSTPFLDWCGGALDSKRTLSDSDLKESDALNVIAGFLKCGVDLNLPDGVGATPLMRALISGKEDVALALVSMKVDVLKTMRNGLNAFHLAAFCGRIEFLRSPLVSDRLKDLFDLEVKNLQPDVRSLILSNPL